MDQSVTRRGQPCWYRVEGVNYIAINDSFMLEGSIYFILKKHFRSEPYYVYLLDLFHDVRLSFLIMYFAHVLISTRYRRRFRQRLGS